MKSADGSPRASRSIPVIDLFAGPGGLCEGISSVHRSDGSPAFDVRLSVEKEATAHRTLLLRAFYRAFGNKVPDSYYDYIRGNKKRHELLEDRQFREEAQKATSEARQATLGESSHATTDRWISDALGNHEDWLLIGGPPCQAYSMAGRSRRRPVDAAAFERDEKHFLYKEYLRIIRKFRPAVFVMENVKGMLSSKHGGNLIFEKILDDLTTPSKDLTYEIRSFVCPGSGSDLRPIDYVIEAENYGIPQTRHRVILLGVRSDYSDRPQQLLHRAMSSPTVSEVLEGLPPIRSRLSREPDSQEAWLSALKQTKDLLAGVRHGTKGILEKALAAAVAGAEEMRQTGSAFHSRPKQIGDLSKPAKLANWYCDARIGGVIQHEARSHMRTDLQRYLFAACFAGENGVSPNLYDFPPDLLPKHKNADADYMPFVDRFRVQVGGRPSTTVVSHISKDGHYYIHPDPRQCRSFTVREAARLQTFPDNYFFEGNRTEQYTQVGNAVPPLLAKQLGEIVLQLMSRKT